MTKPLEYTDAVGEAAESYIYEARLSNGMAPDWRDLFNRMVAAAQPNPAPGRQCLIDGCERPPVNGEMT